MARSETARRSAARIVILAILAVYSLATITPFFFLYIRSFVPTAESTRFHAWLPPNRPFNLDTRVGNMATFYNLDLATFKREMGISGYLDTNLTLKEIGESYAIHEEDLRAYFQRYYLFNGWISMLGSREFYRSFLATVGVTVVSIVLGELLGSATGLGLSRFSRKWQTLLYTLYLLQLVIPGVATMLPSYIIVRTLHLTNTYAVLVLSAISGGALSTMIFTSAAAGVPREIQESLTVDGGGSFRYYHSMLLPLTKPAIGAWSLITLPQVWNSLLGSLLYNEPGKYLLMAYINAFAGNYSTNYQAIYAGLGIALLPILLLYIGLQRLFVRAALTGAVKG